MGKKKKPADSTPPPDDQSTRTMGFRAGAELRLVIEELAKRERRKSAQMIQILVEDALAARKLWPPAAGKTE